MSSLRQTVAEILTFKVTLSEQNQQNLHFGHFWACIKFHFFFQISSFSLKLLKFKHILIFQNFTFVSEAVLELWWSKVSKNTNFSTKSMGKNLAKNFQKLSNLARKFLIFVNFVLKIFRNLSILAYLNLLINSRIYTAIRYHRVEWYKWEIYLLALRPLEAKVDLGGLFFELNSIQ